MYYLYNIICTKLLILATSFPFRRVKTCKYHIAYQVTTTTKNMLPWLSNQSCKNIWYDTVPGEMNELSETK